MTYEERKVFDEWFSEEYPSLVESARKIHRDAFDLVHHTYLATIRASPKDILRNPAGYFHTAMWTNSTRGSFKELYRIREGDASDVANPPEPLHATLKEEALLLARHLSWYDRTILDLYLEGYNMRKISRETGIPHTNLYQSLHRTKKKIRNAFRRRQNQK